MKILHAVRIVKNPDKWEAKMRQWIDDFAAISQFIYKKPLNFVLLFLLCLTEPIIQLSMPYFVLMALCGGDLAAGSFASMSGWEMYWMCVVITMYGQYAASYIPTPGASGAMETLFMFGFADLAANKIFWVVMVWRFLNYYVYVVCGLGMNIFDIIRSFYRKHKAKKKALADAGGGGAAVSPEGEDSVAAGDEPAAQGETSVQDETAAQDKSADGGGGSPEGDPPAEKTKE